MSDCSRQEQETSTGSAPQAAGASARPEIEAAVRECLATHYGLRGLLERLPGENLNFLVTDNGNRKHVFKIVDQDMPPEVVAMEFAAIEHALRGGFGPRLPRIIENISGNVETRIKLPVNGLHRARVIEFIEGIDLSSISDISDRMLENVGKTVAAFNQVMRDFHHPAAQRNHRWNLAEAGQHADKIERVEEGEKRELLAWAFAAWRGARERLGSLPWQFIHGDAHDENILVRDEQVTGLIDFGDCCHNPTVCDLATCITYMMMRGDPLHIAHVICEGYEEVRLLSAAERGALYPLVCGRLAASLCILNERKTIDPHNPNWFGGERRTWELLYRMRKLGSGAFGARASACG
jgi:Ser/Thr protein kinase RdoA (MazF antagonist)